MCQQAWRVLVEKSFRKTYVFPRQASHSWFPGHMHKGLGQIQRRMAGVDCVLEVHDARIPLSGRNLTFKQAVSGARPHILLLNKSELLPEEDKEPIRKKLLAGNPDLSAVIFTNCKQWDDPGLESVVPTAVELVQRDRQDQLRPDSTVLVVGIPNVGKSTVINKLRSANLYISGRPASVAPRPGHTKAVGERIRICDRPPVYILDSPGIAVPYIKDMHTGMKLALCATLKDELVGEDYIADYLLYWLNINHNFSYVSLMDLTEPEDDGAVMLAKAAIAKKEFKKIRDVSRASGERTIPNMQKMALLFIKHFRKGNFGPVHLDSDLFHKISFDAEPSRKAKIY